MQSFKLIFILSFYSARRYIILIFLSMAFFYNAGAQSGERLRLYNSFDQDKLYNVDTTLHTVWKPVLYADSLLPDKGGYPWFKRKFFHEHLLQVQDKGFNLYGDIVVDEYIGKSNRYSKIINNKPINLKTPSMDTRGYEVSGNVGNKFYFETNFYENQGKFGGYIDSFIRRQHIIPGQGSYKNIGDGSGFDFSASSARLTYVPGKTLLVDLGYGKNFIGDGYRSLLLSDWSFNYPYLRVALTFGKFQYSVMWSQYITDVDKALNDHQGYFRKWAQTYLLDWKPADMLSISLFESVVWPGETHDAYRATDISPSLLSPVIFLHGSKSPAGVENNDIVGLNAKVKFYERSFFYGQLVVNQLGKLTSWKNRTGLQVGMRSGDVFEIPNLNLLAEFNTVRPYTYGANSLDVTYTNFNQPLAHPLGANFTEGIAVASYSQDKWWFRVEGFVATYGADSGSSNYGGNLFVRLPKQPPAGSVTTGQGVSTKIQYVDFKLAYILNRETNLRLETGVTYRREFNDLYDYKDVIFYVGVRMSFRSLLYDF